MRIKPPSKATLRVFAIAITAIMCTLVILSSVFPLPEGTAWNILSIGIIEKTLANPDPDWLSGWSYRKEIPVNNASADYQMRVIVGFNDTLTQDCGQWSLLAQQYTGDGAGENDWIHYLTVFNDSLFAATGNDECEKGRLLRYNSTAMAWDPVTPWGDQVHALLVFNSSLYGATHPHCGLVKWNGVDDWITIASAASGNPYMLCEYNGKIYTTPSTQGTLLESTGASNWTQVAPKYGSETIPGVDMMVYDNGTGERLFCGTNINGYLLRWNDVDAFEKVADTYGNATCIHSLQIYDGDLYGGGGSATAVNDAGYLLKWNKTDAWELAAPDDGQYKQIDLLEPYGGTLIGETYGKGLLLRWAPGTPGSWQRIVPNYGPDPENYIPDFYAMTIWNGRIYAGTIPRTNSAGGRLYTATIEDMEGHCNVDFSDVRFTGADGTSTLPYWMESETNSTKATFFIKTNGNSTLYAYYDNSGATSSSNGTATFVDFSDFDDLTGWTQQSGSWSTSGGALNVPASGYLKRNTELSVSTNYIAEMKCMSASGNTYSPYFVLKSDSTIVYSVGHYSGILTKTYNQNPYGTIDATTYAGTGNALTSNTYYIMQHTIKTSSDRKRITQQDRLSIDTPMNITYTKDTGNFTANAEQYWGLRGIETGYVDWVLVRTYLATEPTWGVWGAEEESAPEISNTPDSKNFGVLEVNTTSNTSISYFTLNNTGDCTVDVTIEATNATGGDDTWALSSNTTPGENIYGLQAGLDDDDDNFDVTVNLTANAFVSDLAEDDTQSWGLKIYMPTSLTGYDGQEMAATITLVASESS